MDLTGLKNFPFKAPVKRSRYGFGKDACYPMIFEEEKPTGLKNVPLKPPLKKATLGVWEGR